MRVHVPSQLLHARRFVPDAEFLLIAALGGVAIFFVVAGTGHYAVMFQQRAMTVDREHAVLCETVGLPAGTHEHVVCKADLMELRTRHNGRRANERIP
jgi:hypothetical protein